MSQLEKYREMLGIAKELVNAEAGSLKACERMRNLPWGSSRAKSTAANAKWSIAAEYRDRVAHRLHVAVVRAGLAERFSDDYYGTFPSGHKWNQILIERERP